MWLSELLGLLSCDEVNTVELKFLSIFSNCNLQSILKLLMLNWANIFLIMEAMYCNDLSDLNSFWGRSPIPPPYSVTRLSQISKFSQKGLQNFGPPPMPLPCPLFKKLSQLNKTQVLHFLLQKFQFLLKSHKVQLFLTFFFARPLHTYSSFIFPTLQSPQSSPSLLLFFA